MGYDGLCALTSFNISALKIISVNQDRYINVFEGVYAVAMNTYQAAIIKKDKYYNKPIRRDINEILQSKFWVE